ncbi:MAG: hypothetical protein JOZ63_01920, partial [Planctomycetaceae bacterium]|nr:hypothetical protein [Planctomycetaceae bacterium]
ESTTAAQSDPNTFNLGGVPFHIDPVTKQLTPGAAPAPTPPPEPMAKWYSKSSKDLADRIEAYHDEHKHKAADILKHGAHQIHALRHEAHLEEKSKSLASEMSPNP